MDLLIRFHARYNAHVSDSRIPRTDLVIAERERRAQGEEEARLDAALVAWNDFDAEYGAFADEHSELTAAVTFLVTRGSD